MEALDLARWQFGITTVYHFIFVPLTIGLTPLVALMQTFWYRTGKDHWFRLTKFFGKLMLINFAIGVATGIVQEFQFGMNWSEYSRLVGDVFGAPLAMEALAAFFIESTFLGVWIFGWGRLPKGVHLASIWLVGIASNLSAFFILAANSFMQYPVGAVWNPETGRAETASLGDVLFSELTISTVLHTVTTGLLVAGTFIAAISVLWIVKLIHQGKIDFARAVYRPAAVFGLITIVVAGIGVAVSGHHQAQIISRLQPLKMAAAEGLCETPKDGAPFTLIGFGDCSDGDEGMVKVGEIPGLFSLLAKNSTTAKMEGYKDLVNEMREKYPPRSDQTDINDVSYGPNVMISFWSFRLMMLCGLGSALLALAMLWAFRRGRITGAGWLKTLAIIAIPAPFLGASFGWIFTEMGRQPWIVYPNGAPNVYLLANEGVSPAGTVSSVTIWISIIGYTLLYAILAVVWSKLMFKYAKVGVQMDEKKPDEIDDNSDKPLSFAY